MPSPITIHDPLNALLPALKAVSRRADRARFVRNCRDLFGVLAKAPWPMPLVVALLEGTGFDCDSRYLARLIDEGVTSPTETDYGFAFTDEQVGELLFALHDRRRWLAGRFMGCKSPAEVARDERTAADAVEMIEFLANLDPRELRARFAKAIEPRLRKLFLAAIRLQEIASLPETPSEADHSEPATEPDLAAA